MTVQEMSIALFNKSDDDFQREFSTKMNPIEYAESQKRFRRMQDEFLYFLHSLKPIVDENTDQALIEVIDEMDQYLQEECTVK